MGDELSDNVKLHLKVGALVSEMKTTNQNLERIYQTVYGDGNGEKGLVIKTDRLAQAHSNNKRITLIAITSAIGLIVKAVWDSITKN